MGISFYIPMFWFYIPLGLTLFCTGLCLLINTSQDQSGAGMVLLVLIPVSVLLNLVAWLIYFAVRSFIGIL